MRLSAVMACLGASLAACGSTGYADPEAFTRTGLEANERVAAASGSIFGEGGLSFGGPDRDSEESASIGVNSYLWRATLDTLSFMPVATADPFGGVVTTDWYSLPTAPDERLKVNAYILSPELRADGVRVSVFRQVRDPMAGWVDAPVEPATATALEDAILTRAREFRVASAAE